MISRARVFFTLAMSASRAACSSEWPLNSSTEQTEGSRKRVRWCDFKCSLSDVTLLICALSLQWICCLYMSRFPLIVVCSCLCESSQVSLSLSSGVGAMSTALLLWQLSRVGSAPWLSSREHTSTRFLDAASWRGVNCHKSIAFTQAPCCRDTQQMLTRFHPAGSSKNSCQQCSCCKHVSSWRAKFHLNTTVKTASSEHDETSV